MSSIPPSMRAVQIKDGKGPSSNLFIDAQTPVPQLDGPEERQEILVKVVAFGLNRMDLLQREGMYPLPPGASPILGVEFSGTVVDAGKSSFKRDQEVFGLATGGAYAEYIKVPARMVLPKPKELSWEQAAAIPENFLTAFQALTLLSNLQKGEDVLVHAGASGVGLAAIQIAKSIGANKVYVTAGSEEKIKFCESIGAEKGINYKSSDWAEELSKLTDGKGVNVIMDFVGAPYLEKNLSSLARDGRLVLQGFMGGMSLKEFNMGPLLFKRLKVEGSTLRSRDLKYQSDLVQSFLKAGFLDSIVGGIKKESKEDKGHHLVIHKVNIHYAFNVLAVSPLTLPLSGLFMEADQRGT
jgi:putative PIG3 family NAD(P)H quinone oxidoreductase